MKQAPSELQVRQDASPVLPATAEPLNATSAVCGLSSAGNPEERSRADGSRPYVGARSRHDVFVLDRSGRPLTPTTAAHARRLLKAGAARPTWSKFSTFGIQLLNEGRREVPPTSVGIDTGARFEGYSIVVGSENELNVQWRLPDKAQVVRRLSERRVLRRARRSRKCRRRPRRDRNRVHPAGWLTPAQASIVASRLKAVRALLAMFPVRVAGIEDVRFQHTHCRWGSMFTTAEVGKNTLRSFLTAHGVQITEFLCRETKALRVNYGYHKSDKKSATRFSAHCTDSLSLALGARAMGRVQPGLFVVVDDTYRSVRRKLHDTQPARGGTRRAVSSGPIRGLHRGMLVAAPDGQLARLCGELYGAYRYRRRDGTRSTTKKLPWASGHFMTTLVCPAGTRAASPSARRTPAATPARRRPAGTSP